MSCRSAVLVAILAVLFCLPPAQAAQKSLVLDDQVRITDDFKAVPDQLNYQGYLVNAADSSAVNATLGMTFRLFDAESGGVEQWSETHAVVQVSDGLFGVLLGSVTPFPDGLFDGADLWLQTEVGLEVLSPRKPLASVAYSHRSNSAEKLLNFDLTDLDDRWVNEGQANSVTSDMVVDGAGSGLDADMVDGQQAVDFISMDDLDHLDAADGTPQNAIFVDNAGQVGIGAASPAYPLDVNGAVNATTYYGDGSNLTGIAGTPDNDWTVSGNDMHSAVSGNVGIGTTAPAAKLDVSGTVNVGMAGTGYDVNFYGTPTGARLLWDNARAAFRAGQDEHGTYWAPESIGLYSFATGYETKATGTGAIAMGYWTTASGIHSVAMGEETHAGGRAATAMGYYSGAGGDYSTAMGWGSHADGFDATAIGYFTHASGDHSTALGTKVEAGPAAYTMVFGNGAWEDKDDPLVNNIENSLMVGFNSDIPTLFVGPSSGAGTTGKVGIGNSSPAYPLDVNGAVNATTYYGDGSHLTNISGTTDNDWTIDGDNIYHQTGNVGIGTTSPSEKLHVDGNIRAEDAYLIGSSPVLSITGAENLLVGVAAGANNTGEYGTFVGHYAGEDNQGDFNTFIGQQAGINSTGNKNTFLGQGAGYNNTTGFENTFLGQLTGVTNNTGSCNTFLGKSSGYFNATGDSNVFVGYRVGYNETSSAKLYIDNSQTTSPLIWGDFRENRVVINGNGGVSPSDNTLLVNGSLWVNGSACGTENWCAISDRSLKKNIATIPEALEKVRRLRGVNFEWQDPAHHQPGRQMGFVAQEAVEVIPEVISGEDGHYAMQYGPITALLVEALKEQQRIIESLEARLESLESAKR